MSTFSSTSSSSTSLALANSTALSQPTGSSFFTAPAPSSTNSSNDNDGNGSNNIATSSSLYLFTFLATLLLLLAVSCAIVIRSFIIRRRFHRRVQQALAEGVILPPPPGAGGGQRGRRDFGEKPKLWDAHLVPDEPESSETKWHSMMPVSVRVLSDKLTGTGQRLPETPPRPTFLQAASLGLVRGRDAWRPRFLRSQAHLTPLSSNPNSTSSPSSDPAQPSEPVIEDVRLQVSVLIAMPSPYRPRVWSAAGDSAPKGKTRGSVGDGDDDEELPDVSFGVTEIPWKITVPSHSTTTATATSTLAPPSGNHPSSTTSNTL